MANFYYPILPVTNGPVQILIDGVPVTIEIDTLIPANSISMPVNVIDGAGLPIDFATEAEQILQTAELVSVNSELDSQTTLLTSLDGKDFATQTTLALLEAKDFATETTLALLEAKDFATETTLATRASETTLSALLTELQLKADLTETQPVSLASVPLPTGAATEATLALLEAKDFATQTTLAALAAEDFATETTLALLNGKIPALGQALMAASLPVVISSDQSAIPISGTVTATNPSVSATGAAVPADATFVGGSDGTNLRALKTDSNGELQIDILSSALPTGAATETTLAALAAEDFATQTTLALLEAKDFATQTTLAALAAEDFSTETTLAAMSAKLPAALGQTTKSGSLSVTLASDSDVVGTTTKGRTKVALLRNDYSSVNVTTSAYVQLTASTSAVINKLQIFDSSGSTLVLAVGAAASEVDQIYIFPGGNGDVELQIPAASRISIKAVSANATVGEISINCLS